MRQRNDTGYRQHVSAWPTEQHPDDEPFDVEIGQVKDFHDLIAGFTPVGPEAADESQGDGESAETDIEPVAPAKARGKSRTDAQGGESR